MLRGLVVDAGGVLVTDRPMAERRSWEREHGKPVGFLDDALRQAIGPGWQGGRGEDRIRRELADRVGVALAELPAILDILAAHEVLNTELAGYLGSVRPALRTAVLANAGPGRREELVRRFGVDTLVDLVVVSAEEGLAKPEPGIYLRTCRRLGLAPAECLFVDDTPANVDGARRAGMHAEVFSTVPQLAALVVRLGGPHRG